MAHAERLLPIEQLLSDAAGAVVPRPLGKPSMVPEIAKEIKRPDLPSATRSTSVSPFAADSARKGGSKPELSSENVPLSGSHAVAAGAAASVGMGSAAPAAVVQPAPETFPEPLRALEERPVALRDAVLNALSGGSHRILINILETAEWQGGGKEGLVKGGGSATVVEMSVGAEGKRPLG